MEVLRWLPGRKMSGRRTILPAFLILCVVVALGGCTSSLGPGETNEAGCSGTEACKATPFLVQGVPALTQVSAGSWHTCGLTAEGAAWCWGAIDYSDYPTNGIAPTLVQGGHRFVSIGTGRYHNCALTVDGIAFCWSSGGGAAGGLLCGPSECSGTPVAVGNRLFRTLAVGVQHTCALDLSGAAYCWGFNWMGETGSTRLGQTEREPVQVPGGLTFAEISANHGYTCGLTLEGALYCWGWGEAGQLGVGLADLPICQPGPVGTNVYCSPQPIAATTTLRLAGVSAGLTHACALSELGRAVCWGDNGQGQLGSDVFDTRYAPAPTTDGTWSLVEAGGPTTCGSGVGGGTFCWGLNAWGLLGTGTDKEISTSPQRVAGGHTFTVLSAGATHICGLTASGAAYCWGDNTFLQLGGR